MNKSELIEKITEDTKLTKKDVENCVNSFIENITKALAKKDEVRFIGFGTFAVTERAERTAKNPRTGEEIKAPATVALEFKPGQSLKDAIAGKNK